MEQNLVRGMLDFCGTPVSMVEADGDGVQAQCTIDASHPHFVGHFPGVPILPAASQLQLIEQLLTAHAGRELRISNIKRSKFLLPVTPGMRLDVFLELRGEQVEWKMTSEGNIVSRGTLLCGQRTPHGPLLVIPTFNNADSIIAVVQAAKRVWPYEIVIVNDGSTDATSAFLADLAGVRVLSHAQRQGKGAALMTAFRFAKHQGYRSVITMDADGQHKASDLPLFLSALERSPDALVIGDRELSTRLQENVPRSSRFGCSFSNFWVCIETGRWLTDTQSGFRAYPLKAIALSELHRSHYDFEIEILVRLMWRGVPVESVRIDVHYPPRGERVSHFRPFLDNSRLSLLHTRLVCQRLLNGFQTIVRLPGKVTT